MARKNFGLSFLACLVIGLFVVISSNVQAKDAIYTSFLGGKAVNGYDPVAYFRVGKPVKGRSEFSHQWQGAEWRFANAKNLADFKQTPEQFAPQYGGYCAWAVSQGYTASAEPEFWHIQDGKLYLNYSADVQATWSKDIPGYIKAANGNWPKVIQ